MTYRMRVEHESRYVYTNTVSSSYNEARLTPLTTPNQLVLDSRLSVLPRTPIYGYVDYWGSVVHAFDLQQPHDELVVTGQSVVETDGEGILGGGGEPAVGWAELAAAVAGDTFAEHLAPTPRVPADARLSEVAAALAGTGDPQRAAADAVAWVGSQLRYVAGTTGVHTSAVEAWELGEGVCQDFAHLTLAVLRPMGIPARYCSGYVHPMGDAEVGHTVKGESHAWVEYWVGSWRAVDPTAGSSTGEHHVLVGRGRDYSDVTPLKGIFNGGPTARLEVTVALTRLA